MAVLIPLQGYLVPHAVGRVNFAGRDLTECSDLRHGLSACLHWPMAKRLKLFGITYLVGKISRSNFYFKVHWPSELYLAIGLVYFVASDLTLQETKIASETQGLEVDFPFEGLLTGAILASFCWCTS